MKRKIPLLLLSLVFLSMSVYAGVSLLSTEKEYEKGEEIYESFSQYIEVPEKTTMVAEPPASPKAEAETTDMPPPAEETEEETTDWPVVDFEALCSVNPDVVGWLYLEGTVINYPLLQGYDNNQYLHRMVDGTVNTAGSIFMDYRNQPDFSDRNTILYGHHMQNNTMFAPIANYKEQSFYDEHPVALLLTPEGNYCVEFFAGYVANLNDEAWKLIFASDEEFAAWQTRAVEASTFQSTVTPMPEDCVLTLSTCSYEFEEARYVLLGVLSPR